MSDTTHIPDLAAIRVEKMFVVVVSHETAPDLKVPREVFANVDDANECCAIRNSGQWTYEVLPVVSAALIERLLGYCGHKAGCLLTRRYRIDGEGYSKCTCGFEAIAGVLIRAAITKTE